jgi:hypothetical protein
LPHVPQFFESVCSETQAPPHVTCPAAQAQAPLTQVWVAGHTTPTQAWAVQAWLKQTLPGSHGCPVQSRDRQWPPPHAWPLGHTLPQPPQLTSSVCGSAQWPAHCWCLLSQTQAPMAHVSPKPHTTPAHALSTHAPAEHTWSAWHAPPSHCVGRQAPLPQRSPEAHDLPQLPQFASSVERLTQLPPQADVGVEHAGTGLWEQLDRQPMTTAAQDNRSNGMSRGSLVRL